MPSVTSAGAPLGGTLSATVDTEVGDLVILLVGLPGPATQVGGIFDAFWLNPNAFQFLSVGTQQAGNPVTGSLSVPPQPSLQGLSIVWQAVASGPTTGFAASNPSFALIR